MLISGLAACSKKVPEPTPASARSDDPRLPDGKGGVHKIGNPYQVDGRWYTPRPIEQSYNETGVASWYGRDFHGKRTANGETYDMHALSAAHKTIPLPTLMRVTNLENGKSVIVRVNDRGPFVKDRLIDLSYAAAKALGFVNKGTARVRVQSLNQKPASRQLAIKANHPEPKPDKADITPPAMLVKPAAAPSGNIYVQLGAFASKDNATGLQLRLHSDFPAAHTVSTRLAGTTLYKVRIGPFEDMDKIEETVVSLQQKGFRKPMVIIE